MKRTVSLSVTSSPASRARQRLYKWALKELLAKGYARSAINQSILSGLRQVDGNKLDFIRWIQGKPSYHEPEQFDPRKHSSFVINQVAPAIEFNLKSKGYGNAAIQRITGMMLTDAGDTGHCSIASLWKSVKDWPAAR